MSQWPPPDLTNNLSLSIPFGIYFYSILEPTYNGELWDGEYPYYYTIEGYGTSDDGSSVPSLPEGLTFNEQTSELFGTVNSNDFTPSNSGEFLVTVCTDVSFQCWFTIVNISYYTPLNE
jgi:hypothetical protein